MECLEIYSVATDTETERKRAILLHLVGEGVYKLSKSIVEAGPPFNYETLKTALTTRFEPLANPDYERFLFRQARQNPEESVRGLSGRSGPPSIGASEAKSPPARGAGAETRGARVRGRRAQGGD